MSTTAARSLDMDSWIDRKQAAQLAGCHVDSIRRDEKTHQLSVRTGLGGTVLLRVGDLVAVGRIDAARLDPQATAAQVAEAGALRTEVGRLRVDNARLIGAADAHQQVVATLRAQVTSLEMCVRALASTGGQGR